MEATLIRLLMLAPQVIDGVSTAYASWQKTVAQAKAIHERGTPPTDAERKEMDDGIAALEARLHAQEPGEPN